ncbi:MAG: IS200/IS605 family transposase [Cyanobacteria bacterium P01_A01_bin.83]
MNHAAFEIYYHLTLQIKYRHKLITEEMLQRLESIFRNTLNKWRCNIISFSGETDHIHVLFEAHPSLNLSQLIANLKTVSSRLIRKEYSEYLAKYFWKPYFWSSSYGLKSISKGAEFDVIVRYIQNQERACPHLRPQP